MAKVPLRAYNREIETMIDRGHLDEAIANCRHILKTYPKHLETYRLLGKAYLEYKRYPEAEDIFSRVLAAVPDDFVANVGMSIIRDEANKLDDAIWHMERAFETQPSNAAIQSELQRLYGRRDGVQPPRIRMTRGALAHMYVQGELYPQAISEIKSVLNEDGGRVDMQALLARAYYRSGLKNDAADVASSVLRTYPQCLDANRVLMEILGSDRSESAQTYRQRVIELDPYAAHVTSTVFQSNEAPEAAVNLERLDWNGQPVGMQSDWGTSQAISLEEDKSRDEQPDWLKGMFDEPAAQSSQPFDSPTNVLGADSAEDKPKFVPAFDDSTLPATSAGSAEDIPPFLREAGWGQSTGAFDESKSAFKYEEPETQPPLAKGELPDWVKAMAPVEAEQPSDQEEEGLPDWINSLGTGVASTSFDSDQQSVQAQAGSKPSDDQPEWIKGLDQGEQTAPSSDQPDWLKGFSNESESMPATPTEQPDWINQLDQPRQAQPDSQPSDDQLDWLKQLDQPQQSVPSASDDQPDWLKGFGSEFESAPAASSTESPDWLGQLGEQPKPTSSEPSATEFDVPTPIEAEPESTPSASRSSPLDSPVASTEAPEQPIPSSPVPSLMDNLGTSEQERDDSFAWLENLAARQGASEGLLTKPEDRLEEEPDWVKRAKGLSTDQAPTPSATASQPAGKLEELGKSEQERDDSFAWLENLAARQGASEGLLTKPEDRLEQEPDWVRQARELGADAEQPPISPPPAVKVPSSIDDTAAWLTSLDEEKPTAEPAFDNDATGMWLKSLDEEPVKIQPAQPVEQPESDLPTWMHNVEREKSSESEAGVPEMEAEQPAQVDATAEWTHNIEETQPAQMSATATSEEVTPEASDWMELTEESVDVQLVQPAEQPEPEIPSWMQNIEVEKAPESELGAPTSDVAAGTREMEMEQPAQIDDLPEWMQFIEDKESAEGSTATVPANDSTTGVQEQATASDGSEWKSSIEEPVAPSMDLAEEKPTTESEEIPAWLSSLEQEEARVTTPAASDEDLPAWLRGEEGAAPEPLELEPTQAADWQPLEAKQPEPTSPVSEAVAEEMPAVEPSPLEETEAATSEPEPEPYKEPAAPIEAASSGMPVEPILEQARENLSSGNIQGALNTYGKLIRKTRLLDEVIYDLRDALYRFPVDVDIWQALGDAYMRANRLQDALDSYTKAEELLR